MPTRMDRFRWWKGRQLVRQVITGAVWLLALAGCTGQEAFRSEVIRVSTDQSSQSAALTTLAARIDAVERRLHADAHATGQLRQELKEAIEVLLKKALETDNRLASLESALTALAAAKRSEKAAPPAKRQVSAVNGAAEPRAPRISLGMTQEEVRRILGNPVNAERAGEHIFWYYSHLKNEEYVVFEQSNGRVSGWLGL
jgi:TolA-binding protein